MRIEEVIVVEGKNDSRHLREFFDCETIETHGSCLSKYTLNLIKRAQKTRGVIILTDPDSPGEKIRAMINEAVPGCGNAYLLKEEARTEKKVGVEHASEAVLKTAFSHVLIEGSAKPVFTLSLLQELGLSGKKDSAALREQVARAFHLGKCNTKQLCHRLNILKVTPKEVEEVLQG